MSLLDQEKTIATVLAEQLTRVRATIKAAEWVLYECPWCSGHDTVGHAIDCEAFTPSGIPK